MADTDKPKKKSSKKDKSKDSGEKKSRSKSRERSKSASRTKKDGEKASKKSKETIAEPPSSVGAATAAADSTSMLFNKFDGGSKGYLSRADFAKAVQELSVPPAVGPYAAGSGHSIYGSYAPSPSLVIGQRGGYFPPTLGLNPVPSMLSSTTGDHNLENNGSLLQAFQTRLAALSSVAASLIGKREAMAHQMGKLQSRAQEVTAARNMIENETMADTEAILHKLRSVEAAKLSVLQSDMDSVAADVAAVDHFYRVLQTFQATPGQSKAALDFMRAYPELCAEADRLIAKPLKMEIDTRADDFDREIARRHEMMARYDTLVDLVGAKDRIILQILKERDDIKNERDAAIGELGRLKQQMERQYAEVAALKASRASLMTHKASHHSHGGDDAKDGHPRDTEEWIRLTEELTTELNEVTDRLIRLQAYTGVTVDSRSSAPSHHGAAARHTAADIAGSSSSSYVRNAAAAATETRKPLSSSSSVVANNTEIPPPPPKSAPPQPANIKTTIDQVPLPSNTETTT